MSRVAPASGTPLRWAAAPLLFVLAVLPAACSSGSGPDERPGLLQVTAADVDGANPGLGLAGFDDEEVTTLRVQISSGPRVVVDSTFIVVPGDLRRDFALEPNTYQVLVEAFQQQSVLTFNGLGQATVTTGDTIPLVVDLDPTLGNVELVIPGPDPLVVPTNGTAPVRVTVRNSRGQPVAGARVTLAVEPASAGEILTSGGGETNADGVLEAVFDPAGAESQGTIRVAAVDGFTNATVTLPRQFSVVSPVDVGRSTVTVTNGVALLADNRAQAQIGVRIVDAAGVLQAGIPVVIRSSRNGTEETDRIVSAQTVTNAAGEFNATLSSSSSSTLAGDAILSVVADGKQLAATGRVSFFSAVDVVATRVRVTPIVVPADGVSAATIAVEVKDLNRLPLANAHVRIKTRNDNLFRVTPISGRSDANGLFLAQITSTTVGNTVVDVFADGLRTTATEIVIFQ